MRTHYGLVVEACDLVFRLIRSTSSTLAQEVCRWVLTKPRCALGAQYYSPRRTWFSRTLPINCDCSFCEQSSPHTCSVPSFCASSSFHGARYKTGTLNCSIEVHISHQRSCACFMIPQLGPAHR